MKVSIHQPAYLPWPDYFDRIINSDMHVVLDTVQFERGSFINRNRIPTKNGDLWLTVPIKMKGHMSRSIHEVEIADNKWQKKHLRSIEQNCGKMPQWLFKDRYRYLSELLMAQLLGWCWMFNIKRKIAVASENEFQGRGSELILNICKFFDATEYLSGPLGRNYLNEGEFKKAGIKITYMPIGKKKYSIVNYLDK